MILDPTSRPGLSSTFPSSSTSSTSTSTSSSIKEDKMNLDVNKLQATIGEKGEISERELKELKKDSSVEVTADLEELTLRDMPELQWGDKNSRAASVRRRQLDMSVHAIFTYLDSILATNLILSDTTTNKSSSEVLNNISAATITAQSFQRLFLADNKAMVAHHMTEFWY